MKKILAIILACAMVFSLAACGGGSSSGGSSNETKPAADGGSKGDAPSSIKVGFITPLTGVLGEQGEASPWATEYWTNYINNELGGIYLKEYDAKLPIEVKIYDCESSVTKASELTAKAITDDGVDILLGAHTPDLVVPISSVADTYECPCITFDCPLGPWVANGPFEWAFLAHTDSPTYAAAYSSIWKAAGYVQGEPNATVGVIFANDVDGSVLSPEYIGWLEGDGWTVFDPGLYTAGTTDFSDLITKYKENNIEIIFGTMTNPEFAAFWTQCQQMDYDPKVVVVGKAYMLESQVLVVGPELADGLSLEGWWHEAFPWKSELVGITNQEFAAMYTEQSGKKTAAPVAADFALYEVLYDALTRAGSLDKEAIRVALTETSGLDTVMGNITYGENNAGVLPCVGCQWVLNEDGTLSQEIVGNADPSNGISVTADVKVDGFARYK